MAFTTGSPLFEDNFDRDTHYQPVPVENCIFGALKLCIEMHEVRKLKETPENLNLLLENFSLIHRDIVDKMSQGEVKKRYPENDPVVKLCQKDMMVIEQMPLELLSFQELKNRYIFYRTRILEQLPFAAPKVAKMAVGRNTLFHLIKAKFEDQELRIWGVYLARLYFMHKNISKGDIVLPLLYSMMHRFGNQQEWSKDDNIWAIKNKDGIPSEESGPLCYFKPEFNGDMRARTVRLHVMQNTVFPRRKAKLGYANDLVERKLQLEAGLPISMDVDGGDKFLERENKARMALIECGWVDWFDSFFGDGMSPSIGVDMHRISDFDFCSRIQSMTPTNAKTLLTNIAIMSQLHSGIWAFWN
jgi:hypothetical protein